MPGILQTIGVAREDFFAPNAVYQPNHLQKQETANLDAGRLCWSKASPKIRGGSFQQSLIQLM